MRRRLDDRALEKLIRLHFEEQIPSTALMERFGISERTFWNYIKAFRAGKVLTCITLKWPASASIDS